MDKILALLAPATLVETPLLDSVHNETIIDELVEEVTEEESKETKPKKENAAARKKKPAKKASTSKTKSK